MLYLKEKLNDYYKKLIDVENIESINFNDINIEKIKEIQDTAKKSKTLYIVSESQMYNSTFKYVRILEKILVSPQSYNLNNKKEQLILFIFAVDPNFKALQIFIENKNSNDIKNKLINEFGFIDINLVNLEKKLVMYLYKKDKSNEIDIVKKFFKK